MFQKPFSGVFKDVPKTFSVPCAQKNCICNVGPAHSPEVHFYGDSWSTTSWGCSCPISRSNPQSALCGMLRAASLMVPGPYSTPFLGQERPADCCPGAIDCTGCLSQCHWGTGRRAAEQQGCQCGGCCKRQCRYRVEGGTASPVPYVLQQPLCPTGRAPETHTCACFLGCASAQWFA